MIEKVFWTIIFIVAATCALWGPLVRHIITFVKNNKKPLLNRLTIISLCLLVSIWGLRLTIALLVPSGENATAMTLGECIIDSFLDTVRTFGLEEDYVEFITDVKALMAVFGITSGWLYTSVCVFVTALNVAAPIAGGAILLDVLSTVFPSFALWLTVTFVHWKDKFYFSELNKASLALAKGMAKHYALEKKSKPILIFTNTYIDEGCETDSELIFEARRIGAFCVRNDICHVLKRFSKRNKYFLVNDDELENLQMLGGFSEAWNLPHIKNSQIYLFVQSDSYVQFEKSTRDIILSKAKKNGRPIFKKEELPLIVPVNSYRNLVQKLFVDVPLYEPLVKNKDKNDLKLTILGNGTIGTEAFLAAYWFGQMMVCRAEGPKECRLNVNVISNDDEAVFWSKIDYINSEIRETGDPNSDLLIYNSAGDRTSPYFSARYRAADVKYDGLWDADVTELLLESDYIIVALDNDADNISIAQKINNLVGKGHFEKKTDARTVIAYAVFDPILSNALNQKKHYSNCQNDRTDVYMHAFGSIDEVYSIENIFKSKHIVWANEMGNAYFRASGAYNYIEANKKRAVNADKNYSYWADLARAMHVKYKVFSLGWINTSVFDHSDEKNTDEGHRKNVMEKCIEYKRVASLNQGDGSACDEDIKKKKHILAWLEHRRWCAFTRTMGYMCTDDLKANYAIYRSHKNMPLKLHPCLVECRKPSMDKNDSFIHAEFMPNGKIKDDSVFKADKKDLDSLDKISYAWHEIAQNDKEHLAKGETEIFSYDFKMYDYYRYEFD